MFFFFFLTLPSNIMHTLVFFLLPLLEYQDRQPDSQFKRILGVCGNTAADHDQFVTASSVLQSCLNYQSVYSRCLKKATLQRPAP